jgi:hypothetical protein
MDHLEVSLRYFIIITIIYSRKHHPLFFHNIRHSLFFLQHTFKIITYDNTHEKRIHLYLSLDKKKKDKGLHFDNSVVNGI